MAQQIEFLGQINSPSLSAQFKTGWGLKHFLFFLLLLLSFNNYAATCDNPVGNFISIQGKVDSQSSNSTSWADASLDTVLCEGSSIRVGEQSRAAIVLLNDAVLRLDENTTMRLVDITSDEKQRSFLDIIKGAFHSFSRKPKLLTINSPYLNGSIEGTEFVFRVADEQSELTVFEGTVIAANDFGKSAVSAGKSVIAKQGKAPEPRILVNPRNEVQWGLYYPKVLLASDSQLQSIATLLERGRVDQAIKALQPLLAADNGLAFAMSAVINVTLNKAEQALVDGLRAVELSPSSASSIALSYAQQANLELELARLTMQHANNTSPDDALVLARLAELNLMLGDRAKAIALAEKAAASNPELDISHIVLGFSALAEYDHQSAKTAFSNAIALDSSNPLSHLGLGLAKINSGNLTAGRKHIEAAVALDSNDSLLRAYLGKSYFEENRSNLSSEQYDIAKQLDPNDPTAYLYSGMLKQTENLPVAAIRDIEKSIELNNNRAVYRSRLLLDQDRAARGTSIARAYNDIGFNHLANNEASESLMIDPSNASAHRFMSDSYKGMNRTEIGRVSELLQAQLLQDVNLNPIQPSLSATNVNIAALGGPAQAGFNEFGSLFQQNTVRGDVTFQMGNLDTIGAEAAITGTHNKLSYSLGVMTYETEGWRDNNSMEQDLANVFIQYAANDKFNIQTEFFSKDSMEGDLSMNFESDVFSNTKLRDREQDVIRLGMKIKPATHSTLLISYIDSENDEFGSETVFYGPDPVFDTDLTNIHLNFDIKDEAKQIEAQYIYQDDKFNVVAGLTQGDLKKTTVDKTFFTLLADGSVFLPSSDIEETADAEHPRSYIYFNGNQGALKYTVGISSDNYTEGDIEVKETNPKLGIQWDFNKGMTLRVASVQTVKPLLTNNRSIEPSQVAGFNQFYDDVDGSEARLTGIALDMKVNDAMSFSIERVQRNMDIPLVQVKPIFDGVGNVIGLSESVIPEERDESTGLLSLQWLPNDNWSVNAEYQMDSFEHKEGTLTEGGLPISVDTNTLPVKISYFSPSGYFAGLKLSYVDQEITRSQFDPNTFTFVNNKNDDSFAVVDISAGYRLRKYRGIISLSIKNLFDKKFNYQDNSYREASTDPSVSLYIPERMILAQVMFNF